MTPEYALHLARKGKLQHEVTDDCVIVHWSNGGTYTWKREWQPGIPVVPPEKR